jgi:hypothetical protein
MMVKAGLEEASLGDPRATARCPDSIALDDLIIDL